MSKNEIKNFQRIRKILIEKCKTTNPIFGAISFGFSDFIGKQGEAFFLQKGAEIYLKTARMYFNLLTNKTSNLC